MRALRTLKEMYTTPQTAMVLAVQAKIPRKGKYPSPEDVITYIAEQIQEDYHDSSESGMLSADAVKFNDIEAADQEDGL